MLESNKQNKILNVNPNSTYVSFYANKQEVKNYKYYLNITTGKGVLRHSDLYLSYAGNQKKGI